jgi:hypothetical protein
MAFWNDAASEPKRQHRFLVYMDLGNNGFVPYLAKSFTKPSFEVSETEHKFLGNTYYYPGSLTWNEVTCTIINSIDPDGQNLLFEALQQSGYLFPNVQGEAIGSRPGTINKEDSLDALGEVKIAELDGDGSEVGLWTLKNAFIKSATFGDLDYTGDELLNIEIGMRYDWAAYESKKGTSGAGLYGGA